MFKKMSKQFLCSLLALAMLLSLGTPAFVVSASEVKTSETKQKIADGTYSVTANFLHATKDEVSKSDGALVKPAKLVVKNGKATLYMEFVSMILNSYVYSVNKLTNIEFDEVGQPSTYDVVESEVIKEYDIVVDYGTTTNPGAIHAGKKYPSMLAMEIDLADEYTWTVMHVPFMTSMGMSDSLARLTIDYANMTALNINKLESAIKSAEALKASDYTAKSYAAVTSAVAAAKKVLAKHLPTQTEINEATTAVSKAVKGLVEVSYKITYNLNKGTNSKANPTKFTKSTSTITLKNPTRKGYVFKGWYTSSSYKTKVTKIAKGTTKNITVYAKWEKVSVSKATVSKVKSTAKKKVAVTIKKVSGAKGYEVVYSTNSKFKSKKTVTTTSTSKTLTGLKSGKTYYVKVRAYKTDSTGNKVYGSYSTVKKVKVK